MLQNGLVKQLLKAQKQPKKVLRTLQNGLKTAKKGANAVVILTKM
jgi:hypothetical protein